MDNPIKSLRYPIKNFKNFNEYCEYVQVKVLEDLVEAFSQYCSEHIPLMYECTLAYYFMSQSIKNAIYDVCSNNRLKTETKPENKTYYQWLRELER